MRILSWNVNGIRAVHRKGIFLPWIKKEKPDILCLQETKAHVEQLPEELLNASGYHAYFSKPSRKGYSGVAIYSQKKPVTVSTDIGSKKYNEEGRVLVADYKTFILYNVYFPNGASSPERLKYKMGFYKNFLKVMTELREKGRKIIVCGDVNTAYQEIDIFDPKDGEGVSGFLPEERQWMNQFFDAGFFDTYRTKNPEKQEFSWWDYRTGARERDDGWRIDYFILSDNLKKSVKDAFILNDVVGSDHCPIGIEK